MFICLRPFRQLTQVRLTQSRSVSLLPCTAAVLTHGRCGLFVKQASRARESPAESDGFCRVPTEPRCPSSRRLFTPSIPNKALYKYSITFMQATRPAHHPPPSPNQTQHSNYFTRPICITFRHLYSASWAGRLVATVNTTSEPTGNDQTYWPNKMIPRYQVCSFLFQWSRVTAVLCVCRGQGPGGTKR